MKLLGCEDYLRENLYSWRFDSLERRCQHIKQELDIEIHRVNLAKFYRRLNIKYRRPNYHISNQYSEAEMKNLQQDFSIKLNDLIKRGIEVWFLDECSTHFWERRSKLWMDMRRPFFLNLRYKRGSGCAIIGAIST